MGAGAAFYRLYDSRKIPSSILFLYDGHTFFYWYMHEVQILLGQRSWWPWLRSLSRLRYYKLLRHQTTTSHWRCEELIDPRDFWWLITQTSSYFFTATTWRHERTLKILAWWKETIQHKHWPTRYSTLLVPGGGGTPSWVCLQTRQRIWGFDDSGWYEHPGRILFLSQVSTCVT